MYKLDAEAIEHREETHVAGVRCCKTELVEASMIDTSPTIAPEARVSFVSSPVETSADVVGGCLYFKAEAPDSCIGDTGTAEVEILEVGLGALREDRLRDGVGIGGARSKIDLAKAR